MGHEPRNTGPTGRGASHYVTLRVPRQPYCPRCGNALTQQTTAIHRDVAWCLICAQAWIDTHDWLGIAITTQALNDSWTTDRGVRFWTPSKRYKDGIVEMYLERRHEERQTAAVTDAENAWAQNALRNHERRLHARTSSPT